jgi:hypothetical protein
VPPRALVPSTITTRELADLAGVTVRTVQRAAARGRFTCARRGRDYEIEESSGRIWASTVRRPGPQPAQRPVAPSESPGRLAAVPSDSVSAQALAALTTEIEAELGPNYLAVPALVDALEAGLRGAPRRDAALLIETLRYRLAREALGVVRRYVSDQDPAARGEALAFLDDFGGPDEIDVLLPRLEQEPDTELLEIVIDTLADLNCTVAISALRALSQDPRRPPSLRRAAINATNELAFPAER